MRGPRAAARPASLARGPTGGRQPSRRASGIPPSPGNRPAFSTAGLNLNGIAATADGSSLIVNNTVLDKLFTVNPVTGASAAINVAGLIPRSMDGMLLKGSSLWVDPAGTTFNVVVVPAY